MHLAYLPTKFTRTSLICTVKNRSYRRKHVCDMVFIDLERPEKSRDLKFTLFRPGTIWNRSWEMNGCVEEFSHDLYVM